MNANDPHPAARPPRATLAGHFAICRADHWFKQVLVLPGAIVAGSLDKRGIDPTTIGHLLLALFATSLVASSNYVINELLDSQGDQAHPVKRYRPVPAGRVSRQWAIVQWLALGVAGTCLGAVLSLPVAAALAALWIMGLVYNAPPLRSKDRPWIDVVSESANNPIRLLVGWYAISPATVPPASLIGAYWMIGGYFMALKRFAELREIGDRNGAAAYRRSFAFYTEDSLLVSSMFYASAASTLFGAFLIRYRLELILSFPTVAFAMASYLRLALQPASPVQNPERLWRDRGLVAAMSLCTAAMTLLMVIDLPWLYEALQPLGALRD